MMETETQSLTHRRWIGRLVRLGLVAVAILLVARWLSQRTNSAVKTAVRASNVRIQSDAPTPASLGPGDAQIFSRDSSVNLILQGDRILAGLSPKTVAKIRADLERSASTDDTSGLGGSIASFVKKTVANNIDTHVIYPLADIRDIRYEGSEIVIYRPNGDRSRMFGGTKVNDQPLSKSFDPADAERFIAAVKARKQAP
ncbi:MAG: hypothetical protein ACRENU_05660 [Gemmatimonadaceae bacterium]